jgi:putative aldouronate transport system permease protein
MVEACASTKLLKNKSAMRRRTSFVSHVRQNKMLYVLLVPGLAFILVFHYFPLYGLSIAFKDYNIFKGIWASDWIGLQNFRDIFSRPHFLVVVKNTLVINFYKLFINFPMPIIVAILINEIGNRFVKRTTQTIIYFPFFLSWVVVAGIVVNLLSPSTGVLNLLIAKMGFERVNFLASKEYFRTILVLSDLWKILGWHSIIYLTALTGVDPQLYEAAKIDGAGKLSSIWHITLPAIMPTISVLLLLRIGNMMNMDFEQVFLLYNPLVYEVGDVIETYIYRIGLVEAQYDIAAAVGIFKSFIGLSLLMIANFATKKLTGRGLF